MGQKTSFEVLNVEVEKLYQKDIDENNEEEVMQHCEFIAQFVEANGWTMEEYMERWMSDFNEN